MVRYNGKNQSGFTLVELSIVIVIIGLIVAGVFGGQSLVRQGQLRAIISEQSQIKTAVKSFRTEYNAVPGDFSNAFSYWSGCAGGNATNCNGDGNRLVGITSADVNNNEAYRFWEHLNLAQMYPGSFTGVSIGTAFNGGQRDVNLPGSSYDGASITYRADNTTRTHDMIFGADVTNAISTGDIFPVADAASLDEKIDDGLPGEGILRSEGGTPADCYDSATAYNVDNTTGAPCYILIRD